jgi:Uma2 family endonuclease
MASAAQQLLTPAEYLAIEATAEQKSEYYAGEMFAMAGASPEHNVIAFNVGGTIHAQLRGRPCQGFSSDQRVKVSETGLYTYPDLSVVCGEPQFEEGTPRTLLNPTLIVEVLSPTTEAYDREEKFDHYRRLHSLQEYVLIAQDRFRVERYLRQAGSEDWLFTAVTDPQGAVSLVSIGCELALADIYDKVEIAAGESRLRRAPPGA